MKLLLATHSFARGVIVLTLLVGTSAPSVTSAQIPTILPLNDTGIDQCYDSTAQVPCDPVAKDTGTHPRQDGRYGRDKTPGLPKIGSGPKGFDYTKVCNSGELAGGGACPASPLLGTGTNDWGCTKDNVTSLIWEVKTTAPLDLRSTSHTYTWYSTNAATNGGNTGSAGANTCNGTLPGGFCNTQAFVTAVNTAGLCGAIDWRLPNMFELASLVDFGKAGVASPAIDTANFPNTQTSPYWSSNSGIANPSTASHVFFSNGIDSIFGKANSYYVRVVRSGQ